MNVFYQVYVQVFLKVSFKLYSYTFTWSLHYKYKSLRNTLFNYCYNLITYWIRRPHYDVYIENKLSQQSVCPTISQPIIGEIFCATDRRSYKWYIALIRILFNCFDQ